MFVVLVPSSVPAGHDPVSSARTRRPAGVAPAGRLPNRLPGGEYLSSRRGRKVSQRSNSYRLRPAPRCAAHLQDGSCASPAPPKRPVRAARNSRLTRTAAGGGPLRALLRPRRRRAGSPAPRAARRRGRTGAVVCVRAWATSLDAHRGTSEGERFSLHFFLDPADCPALGTRGRRGFPMDCVLSRNGNR
jgi:hypothetical protein